MNLRATISSVMHGQGTVPVRSANHNVVQIPIATKLVLSFLLIIVLTSAIFSIVGVRIIGDRVVAEAQEKVRTDLNSAREIYLTRLARLSDEVRFVSERTFVRDGSAYTNKASLAARLAAFRTKEQLDVLSITDPSGVVLLRTTNPTLWGDDQSHDQIVRAVLQTKEPAAATLVVSGEDLLKESPRLASQACFQFVPTPKARFRREQEETAGLMLKAAAPIFDAEHNFIGVAYGSVLLNRNFEIVDKIKQTVFQDLKYRGEDIGTATIFQDDLRISTNVKNGGGARAIGTRAAEDVYNQVVREGRQWIGRAYVVNNWYITAYEPIRDLNQAIIGILYVGLLERKYLDIKRRTTFVFLTITLVGALVALSLSYFISRKISGSIQKLVAGSEQVAHGNLDATVEIRSNDELQELAETFNFMASALKKRDEKLKAFATRKIMESERLALIGQLAAGVAHEINNPLQGIVTYSHLLLEKMPAPNPACDLARKIVVQANRCRDIIRGLLDFARQRKPDKRVFNANVVLQECLSLVANQALFHNIEIVKNPDPNLPSVLMDPSQIQQVFMNMIINAAEAMHGGGRLTVATRFEPAKQSVEVEFTDTGHGIRAEDTERVFDPFFTTKEVGHGTGLGLAISYGIVQEHKGSISVESEVGKGTTFVVRLPVTAEEGGEARDC